MGRDLLASSVPATGSVAGASGPANWHKGVQFVTSYTIIALMFYFLPQVGP